MGVAITERGLDAANDNKPASENGFGTDPNVAPIGDDRFYFAPVVALASAQNGLEGWGAESQA